MKLTRLAMNSLEPKGRDIDAGDETTVQIELDSKVIPGMFFIEYGEAG